MMCYNCGKPGHPARRYEVLFGRGSRVKGNSNERMYCKGTVEGCHVNSILLDTGCSRTMVRRQLVPQDKFLEGKWVSIRCVHGDTVLYPLADVQFVVEGIPVKVEAAVAESLPVEVILGTDAFHSFVRIPFDP